MRNISYIGIMLICLCSATLPLAARKAHNTNTAAPPATAVAAVVAPATPPPVATGSLWNTAGISLYTDTTSRKVGDLLTVIITQQSTSSTSSNHSTAKDMAVSATPGTGILSGFPGLGVGGSQSSDGTGASSISTSVVDQLSVTVTAILPNGNLQVEGTRSIKMGKDDTSVIFRGVVRQKDIQADNSVSSVLVADQVLEMKGTGPISEKTHPGLLARLFAFIL